jgi:hypothetical protein
MAHHVKEIEWDNQTQAEVQGLAEQLGGAGVEIRRLQQVLEHERSQSLNNLVKHIGFNAYDVAFLISLLNDLNGKLANK